jgi:NDP-sugar pyrophosphorylase family protein
MTSADSSKIQIVITMAGLGQRFRDAGYDVPKYRIAVHGHTLFHWSLQSLRSFIAGDSRTLFIAREADACGEFIASQAPALGIEDWSLLELSSPTDGQATTALKALPSLDPSAPVLIYNIDTFVRPDALPREAAHGDGWVPCFPGAGSGWSFAKTEETSGRILEIREKQRISPHATIGLYWFRSAGLYADLYRQFYGTSARLEAGERYIAPMYNQLVADGAHVYMHQIPLEAVYPLGTPQEVQRFSAAPAPIL